MSEEIITPGDNIQVSESAVIDEIIKKILRLESSLSYSALSAFSEGPREFIKYKLRTRETTDAMIYGGMVHCLVLEPKDFYNRYFVLDDVEKKKEIGGAKPGGTKEYKIWFEEMQRNAGSKILVKADDFKIAEMISRDCRYNDAASRILQICPEREESAEWEYGNYKWRGFKDMSGKDAVADLKTCIDANPDKVARDIYYNGHYIQGAMYLMADMIKEGKDPNGPFHKDFFIIAVDKKGGISCHEVKPNFLEKGRKKYQYLINKFSECILKDSFDQSYEFFAERYDGIYDVDRTW